MKREANKEQREESCEQAAFALPRPSKALTALTTSALALPGVAGLAAGTAQADAPIERATGAASFSYYKEDNLSPSRFSGTGSRDRYEVFQTQLRFDLPMTDRTDLGLDILYEEMSGASPWYVQAIAGSPKPLQVMSGATIEDERFDILADVDFYMDNGKDTISAGISTERDYFAFNLGLGAERNLNEKNTTVSSSIGFSYDWIDPTDADIFSTRPSSEERWAVDLFLGVAQIISRNSTMQVTFNYKHSGGYLSDPYKAIRPIGPLAVLLSDERPTDKDQLSIMLRYRHHFERVAGSLHVDGRFYTDDFGINSLTTELGWYQNILDWITITPSVRWYTQSKADFYEPVLNPIIPGNPGPRHRSSDFRLSPYGAISAKIKADFEFLDAFDYDAPSWLQRIGVSEGMDLIATVSYERYFSDGDISLVDVKESDEAPGLVRFHVFSVSLNGRF